jgi:hypothetical protein
LRFCSVSPGFSLFRPALKKPLENASLTVRSFNRAVRLAYFEASRVAAYFLILPFYESVYKEKIG